MKKLWLKLLIWLRIKKPKLSKVDNISWIVGMCKKCKYKNLAINDFPCSDCTLDANYFTPKNSNS